jgi:hypothetical protein
MLKYGFKNIILICLSALGILTAKAQTEYIVRVNPTTGTFSKTDSIPGVRWLRGYSAYNETTKEYTVMGCWEAGQPPIYLYTLNAETGKILYKPLIANYNKIISLQYSKSTGVLYAMVFENGQYHLATLNKTTGSYTLINSIPNIDGVGEFIIDEANQTMIIRAVDHNPNFAIWTISLATGNIIYHVPTKGLSDLHYDKKTRKIYALVGRPGPTPGSPGILSICTVNPATGVVSIIADLPVVGGLFSGHSTYNENDQVYLFTGVEQPPQALLYSVDVSSGNIISKPGIPTSGVLTKDNLIFFRYDNLSNKLYGLLWEAKTIITPPVAIDSSCKIDIKTRIFPNPTGNKLTIDKNPTICKVTMNMYNTIGQLVLRGKNIHDGYNEVLLSHLSAGIYYYEFISDNKRLLTGKFLKNN